MQPIPHVNAHLDREASPSEVDAVKAAFDEFGVDATVTADLERKGLGDYPWVIYLSMPAGLFLSGFLNAAGKDAYEQLKRLVSRLYEARATARVPRGGVTIIDGDTREWIQVKDNLPARAWQRLFEMKIERTESGVLAWDPSTETWRDSIELHRIK
jgi:hypothetical protein